MRARSAPLSPAPIAASRTSEFTVSRLSFCTRMEYRYQFSFKCQIRNVPRVYCLGRSFSCQLHTASCSLNLGARGTTYTHEEDRMKKLTRQTLAVILLFTFLLGAAIGPALAQQQVKVNINKASVDQLSTLKRIGPSYAQRIVDYRRENGPFQKPVDIIKVRGIGIKTYEANKDIITCD